MEVSEREATIKPTSIAQLLQEGHQFADGCPTREVLKHITSRWGILLLVALLSGTQRYSELRRKVKGISEKMLAQTLQWFEADGFLERIAYPEIPPRVEYHLTPLGQEIALKVESLVDWIDANLLLILSSRKQKG